PGESDFTEVDLNGWNPGPTQWISGINFTGARNIPWTALNANTDASGFSRINFTGQDLSNWNPAVTTAISYVNYTNATRLPWGALNANIHFNGFVGSNF